MITRRCTEAAFVLLAGCAGQEPPCGDPCLLADDHNFRYEAALTIAQRPARAWSDVTIDWAPLARDLQGQPVAAGDIDRVRLVVFSGLAPDEVARGLVAEDIQQSDVAGYFVCIPGDADCALSEFGLLGSYPGIDGYFEPAWGTWLVALATDGRAGARSLLFLDPDEDSDVERVEIDDTSARIDFDVDFVRARPIVLDDVDAVIDWSGLTRTGQGAALVHAQVDRLEVGRYALTLPEIADRFAEIDHLADERWEIDVAGQTGIALSAVLGDAEVPATTDDETWLLALRCSSCDSPVPRFLGVLR